MKLSTKELLGYRLETKEGTSGVVKDILFDQEDWDLRYMDVDFGSVFQGRRILIPRPFLKGTDWKEQRIKTDISDQDLAQCPFLSDVLPVSREYEAALKEHYKLPDYWARGYHPPTGKPNITHTHLLRPDPVKMPGKIIKEKHLDTDLRSFSEILDYSIYGVDGKIGKLSNVLIDTENWSIISSVVDTSTWQPWRSDVIIPVIFISEISYVGRRIKLELLKETVENSPEFHPSKPVNKVVETNTYDFRGRPVDG